MSFGTGLKSSRKLQIISESKSCNFASLNYNCKKEYVEQRDRRRVEGEFPHIIDLKICLVDYNNAVANHLANQKNCVVEGTMNVSKRITVQKLNDLKKIWYLILSINIFYRIVQIILILFILYPRFYIICRTHLCAISSKIGIKQQDLDVAAIASGHGHMHHSDNSIKQHRKKIEDVISPEFYEYVLNITKIYSNQTERKIYKQNFKNLPFDLPENIFYDFLKKFKQREKYRKHLLGPHDPNNYSNPYNISKVPWLYTCYAEFWADRPWAETLLLRMAQHSVLQFIGLCGFLLAKSYHYMPGGILDYDLQYCDGVDVFLWVVEK